MVLRPMMSHCPTPTIRLDSGNSASILALSLSGLPAAITAKIFLSVAIALPLSMMLRRCASPPLGSCGLGESIQNRLRLHQFHQIFDCPDGVRESGFHCGSHAQALMHPAECARQT